MPENVISTLEQLSSIYEEAHPLSIQKETKFLTDEYIKWLEKSRFFAFATSGKDGLDCSPRGDAKDQTFKLLDNKTLIFPDRRGNNRLDSLKNIIANPQIAMMFLIPGVNEALRINGKAQLTTDPDLLSLFDMDGKLPKVVIHVSVEAVYFQCARHLFDLVYGSQMPLLILRQFPLPAKC